MSASVDPGGVMAGISGSRPVGAVVRRYCRARLAPFYDQVRADQLAATVVAEVAVDDGTPFDRQAYLAAAQAVDRVLGASPRDARRPGRPSSGLMSAVTPAARLAAAVEDLPAPIRDIIVLRTFVGLSRDQVADVLGVSDGTVLRLQHAGLTRLLAEQL